MGQDDCTPGHPHLILLCCLIYPLYPCTYDTLPKYKPFALVLLNDDLMGLGGQADVALPDE